MLKRCSAQAVIVILILSGIASAQTLSDSVFSSQMEEGNRLIKEGKWDDSITHFESMRLKFPDKAEIHLQLGIGYMQKRDIEKAEAAFKETIRLAPSAIEAYLRLADLYEATQKLPEALALYDQVIKQNPADEIKTISQFKVNMINGIMQARSQNFEEALKFFKTAEQISPNDPGVQYNIGLVYLQLEDDKQAEAAFKKVIRIHPNHQEAYVRLGILYERKNRIDEALNVFFKVLEIDTRSRGAQIARSKIPVFQGRLLARQGRLDEALTLFLRALSFSGEQAALYYNIGLIYSIKKQLQDAEQAFLKVVSLDPRHQDAYLNLGNLYENQGRLDEALQVFIRAVEINPRTPGGISANQKLPLLQGSALALQGRIKEALAIFEKALTFSREKAAIYFNIGKIHLELSDLQKAEKAFRQTISENPRHQKAYIHLGSMSEQSGDLEKAVIFYEKAVEVNADSPDGKNALVSLYSVNAKVAMGLTKFEEAEKWFKAALEIQPNNPVNFYNLGVFYREINEMESAASAFEKVVALDPKDKNTYLILIRIQIARILNMVRDTILADHYLSSFTGLSETGFILDTQDEKIDEAKTLFSGLMQRAGENNKIIEQVLLEQVEMGREEKDSVNDYAALMWLVHGKTARFSQIRYHLLRGVVLGQEDQIEKAQAHFETILFLDPEEPMAYFNLGFIALRLKDANQALSHFKKAVELSPDDRPKRIRLASLYEEVGQVKNALEHYKVVLKDPDLPDAVREEIEERIRHLFVNVSVTYQSTVDNNVTLSKDPSSDILSSLLGQYQRIYDMGEGKRLGLRISPSLSSYIKDQVSFFSTSNRIFHEWRGYQKRKTVEYEYLFSLFEGAFSSQGHSLAVTGFQSLGDRFSVAGDVRFSLFDSINNSDLDAYQPSASGSFFINGWAGGRLTLGTRTSANLNLNPEGKKFSFVSAAPSIIYDRALFRGIQFNSSYEFSYKAYIYQEEGFNKKRIGESHSVRLGLTIGLERGIQIFVNGAWVLNQSNLGSVPPDTENAVVSGNTSSLGKYEKIIGTVGLRLVF